MYIQLFCSISCMLSVEQTSVCVQCAFTTQTETKSKTVFISHVFRGLVTQKRVYRSASTLQGNTYPLVGRAVFSLPASSRDLALITQRPMALSSDGHALELMLHRYFT